MNGIITNRMIYSKFFVVILLFICLSSCNGVTPEGPVISSFSADPTVIDEGDSVTLSWVTNATSVTINQGIGSVTAPSGSTSVSPTETTTYTLTATSSAGSVTAKVTVTISTVPKKVIDAVKEDILPEIPEVQSGDPYVCLMLEDPIPAGTMIEEASDIPMKAKASIILQEEKYFFYLDLAPGAFYAHPVKYLLVDKEGSHEEYDAKWWPRIGGEVPASLVKDIPDQEDVIASNVEVISPVGTVVDYILPELYSQLAEGFIVVQGVMPEENFYNCAFDTYLNGVNFFNAYKNAFSEVEGLIQSQSAQVLDKIEQMVEEGKNVITIYIIALGEINWIKLGDQWFSVTQFKNEIALYPDVIFNFILGSSYSGSFAFSLHTLDNVYVAEAACYPDEAAWPDLDFYAPMHDWNLYDVGSEWTSSLIEAMEIIASDSDKMDTIQEWAYFYNAPVTSMLICEAAKGALGDQTELGLTKDYDYTHLLGWTTPMHYCSF